MHWNASALRQAFLSYFQDKGHLLLPSDSLVPKDPSLLFTSAGMVQFKPYFLGAAQPPAPCVTTVQKCLRTTDIESVGDLSHLTFFEMLGNFSFGDYFKREAILFAWEFLTERLKVDTDRLQFTVFQDDDEAFDIWHREVGIPENRIWRLGEKTNFWPANAITEGPNGPCGPCSEIFYDTRLDTGCTNPNCGPACDCGRWLEIWNLVFMQYERSEENGKPKLTPLPKKNIDTGMGLERTAAVLMGLESPFETDVFEPIVRRIEQIAGVRYKQGEPTDTAIRLIADHIRAATFTIADGVIPQNEGRGYVLRRIIRRAILRGQRALRIEQPFFADLVPAVIDALGEQYPELVQRQDYITTTLRYEEQRFRHTVQAGLARLEEMLADAETQQTRILAGERVFTLYDTYGFPVELTREIAAERGIAVDMQGFEQAMAAQRQRAREASGISEKLFVQTGAALAELAQQTSPTAFVGYDTLVCEAQVVGLVRGGDLIPEAHAGETVEIVLNRTPFYAESGGQVGDTGVIEWHGGRAEVLDTQESERLLPPPRAGTGGRAAFGRNSAGAGRRRTQARHPAQPHRHAPAARRAAPSAGHACRAGGVAGRTRPPALRLHAPARRDARRTGTNRSAGERETAARAGSARLYQCAHRRGASARRDDAVRREVRRARAHGRDPRLLAGAVWGHAPAQHGGGGAVQDCA
jgi:alanyl-tRNA synthetase